MSISNSLGFGKKLGLAAAVAALMSSGSALAYEAGDILVRVGSTSVAPEENSDQVGLNGSVSALNNVLGAPSELGVDSNTQLGLTVTYMLDKNWGVELLAATPFEHTASGTGALAGVGDIAEVKHLPPTLSAVYHFDAIEGFQPYVGAGINYTIFFQEDLSGAADTTLATLGLTGGDIELDDSIGLSLQVGADYHIDESWSVNASVRWIDIDTEAEITFDSGDKLSADLELDPFVYTLSVGYKF